MAGFNDARPVLHTIELVLYPNVTPGGAEDTWIARAKSERAVGIAEVCGTMKKRGGFTGNVDDAVSTVTQYLRECVYHLCDGFEVDFGYFTVKPRVSGVWRSRDEAGDRERHPLSFTFRAGDALRAEGKRITVEVKGYASSGAIESITDETTGASVISGGGTVWIHQGGGRKEEGDSRSCDPEPSGGSEPKPLLPPPSTLRIAKGGILVVKGDGLKVNADDAHRGECGVFFARGDGDSEAVRVPAAHLVTNTHRVLAFIVPGALKAGAAYRLVIKTQSRMTSYTRLLVEPRVIQSDVCVQLIE